MKQHVMRIGGLLSILLLLAGCWWGGSKESGSCPSCPSSTTGEPLICFGTKVVLTFEDFKKKIKMLQEAQPGIEQIIASMPEKEQFNIFVRFSEGCVAEALGKEYVKDKGLANTPEFIEMSRQAHEALDGQLYMQAFQNDLLKELDATVDKMTDAELRSYYEQNRDKNQVFHREPFRDPKGASKEFAAFDKVRDQVKQAVKQAKMQEFFETKLEELKQKYGVKIEEACFHKLVVKKEAEPAQDMPTESRMKEAQVVPATPAPLKAAA